jgi:glycosyltransferase involved in cell wall biosynthesis
MAYTVSVITSLYRCKDFLEGYLHYVSKVTNLQDYEFILVHNDPTKEELEILKNFSCPEFHCIHVVVEREGLYASWNRAIKMASGKYITVWNVDDIRFPDSIARQANTLEANPWAAVCYGDMFGSDQYGLHVDRKYTYPDWVGNKQEFFRSYLISCFQMWRKSIHAEIGYYDEQFKCVGDFDFQVRAALYFPFIKSSKPLGIYLENQGHKISSSSRQVLENNIVYLRYGVYSKLQLHLVPKSLSQYQKNRFLFFNEWHSNKEKSPFHFFSQAAGAIRSLVSAPWYLAKGTIKTYLR